MVRIASQAAAPRSSAAATASASSRAWPRSTGRHVPAPQHLEQHRPVGVVDLVRVGPGARRAHLVAGREHADPEPRAHRQRAEPDRGREREVLRRAAGGRRAGSGRPAATSSPAGARVRAGLRRALETDRVAVTRHVLLQHHRVDACGQQRAGEDAQRLAPARPRPGAAHRPQRGPAPAAAGVRRASRRPTPPRSRSRRPRRWRPAGAPASPRRRARGCGRRPRPAAPSPRRDRREPGAQPRQRVVDGDPVDAGRQREAVVAQLRRVAGAAAARSVARRSAPRIQPSSPATTARVLGGRGPGANSAASPPAASSAAKAAAAARTCPASRIGVRRRGQQRRIDLGQRHRRVRRREPGLERPDRGAGEPRVAPQPRERGDAGQRLRPDRPRVGELPAALGPGRDRLDAAEVRQPDGPAVGLLLGHAGMRRAARPAPERAAAKRGVDRLGDREGVVAVVRAVARSGRASQSQTASAFARPVSRAAKPAG